MHQKYEKLDITMYTFACITEKNKRVNGCACVCLHSHRQDSSVQAVKYAMHRTDEVRERVAFATPKLLHLLRSAKTI